MIPTNAPPESFDIENLFPDPERITLIYVWPSACAVVQNNSIGEGIEIDLRRKDNEWCGWVFVTGMTIADLKEDIILDETLQFFIGQLLRKKEAMPEDETLEPPEILYTTIPVPTPGRMMTTLLKKHFKKL